MFGIHVTVCLCHPIWDILKMCTITSDFVCVCVCVLGSNLGQACVAHVLNCGPISLAPEKKFTS